MKWQWLFCIAIVLQSLYTSAQTDSIQKAYFDYNETVEVLDAATAGNLKLFDDVKKFKEARIFKIANGYKVIITKTNFGEVTRNITAGDFELIQQKVTNYRAEENRRLKNTLGPAIGHKKEDQLPARSRFYQHETSEGGHNTLMISSTLYGAFVYGPLLAGMYPKNDGTLSLSRYLMGFYGTSVGAYLVTRNRDIHYGGAVQYATSSFVGLPHGVIFYSMVNPADTFHKSLEAAAMIGSITEGITGYYIARQTNLAPGQALMASSNALWGIAEGYFLALAFKDNFNLTDLRLLNGVVLGTSLYGYYFGYSLTKKYSYTIGDGLIFNNVIYLGYMATLAANAQFNFFQGNYKITLASLALAYPFSVVLAEILLKDYDFMSQQGFIVSLSTLFGGIVGSIVNTKHALLGKRTLTTFIGGALGFTGAYLYERKYAETGFLGFNEKINIQLSPTLTNISGFNSNPSLGNMGLGFQLRCRF